jgi:hypothetical protein
MSFSKLRCGRFGFDRNRLGQRFTAGTPSGCYGRTVVGPAVSLTLKQESTEHQTACAAQGLRADCCDYSDCATSELLFPSKIWIYWLHISAALVGYPMFAR